MVDRSEDLRVGQTVGRLGDRMVDRTVGHLEELRVGQRAGRSEDLRVDGMVGWPRLEALWVRFVALVPWRFQALKPA